MKLKASHSLYRINNELGMSSLAMAMFLTLLLGYFSVLALGSVQNLMTNQKLSDAHKAKINLVSELTLLLNNKDTCVAALKFQSLSNSGGLSGVLNSLNFPTTPPDTQTSPPAPPPTMTTSPVIVANSTTPYDNLNIKDISLKGVKTIRDANNNISYLSNLLVSFNYPNSSRVLTASFPMYFTFNQTMLANGSSLAQSLSSCFSSQASGQSCNSASCVTWHDTVNSCTTTYIYNPVSGQCDGVVL